MDWAQDDSFCDGSKSRNVFKYHEMPTNVVYVSPSNSSPLTWLLRNKIEWDVWLETEYPTLNGSNSGLVLILARRAGESRPFDSEKLSLGPSTDEVIYEKYIPELIKSARVQDTPPMSSNTSGQRTLQTLPFSEGLFQKISKRFFIHSSITRCISRADIPALSAEEIQMGNLEGDRLPTYVYTCRSSNAWPKDLALSATYFPQFRQTYAVFFGVTQEIENQILKRLKSAMSASSHPLLMPGIFIELERQRQVILVEDKIDELETRIQELDITASNISTEDDAIRNQAKRAAWLDAMYLRNQLITLTVYLKKFLHHANHVNRTLFQQNVTMRDKFVERNDHTQERRRPIEEIGPGPTYLDYSVNEIFNHPDDQNLDQKEIKHYQDWLDEDSIGYSSENSALTMRQHGLKFGNRIQDIIHEFEEKIRDCNMRVEGMAMAAQWAEGETNLELVRATSRDSRHMRSIALVTMIFLPGTFFASIFSMGMFDWFGKEDGEVTVSKYFWIYIVMAVASTLMTVGFWWYFGVYRYSKHRKPIMDEEISLSGRFRARIRA